MKYNLSILIVLFIFNASGQMPLQDSPFDTVPAIHVESPTMVHKPKQKVEVIQIPEVPVVVPSTKYTFVYDSLFAPGKGISAMDIYSRKNIEHARDYQFALILLAMLIYVTWITYTYQKELRDNLTVIVNSNLGQQIYRDREFSANIFKFLTFLNFAVITGILIYLLAVHFQIDLLFNSLLLNAASAVLIVILAYFIKGLIYKMIDLIFHFSGAFDFFRFNSLVIYQLLGIAMFPLVIFAVFAKPPVNDWALYASLILAGIALLVRLMKGLSVLGMLKGFHILYFLLYICALEIAPVLIIYKLFSMWA